VSPSIGYPPPVSLSLLTLVACDPDPADSGFVTGTEPVVAEEVWAVSGGAGDLAWDGSGLLATAEFGDLVLRWDPETDLDEEIGKRLGGSPTGVAVGTDDIRYVSVTDSGVEALVGVLTGLDELDPLATAVGATLFRHPVDLAWAPDGSLTVVDSGAEAIFRVPVDGSPAEVLLSGVEATGAAWLDDVLYLATAEALLRVDGGATSPVGDLAPRGLAVWEGALLATTSEGVARVGEDGLLVSLESGRPGALALNGDVLYVADDATGRIWQAGLGGLRR